MPKLLILGAGASKGHGGPHKTSERTPPVGRGLFGHPVAAEFASEYEEMFSDLKSMLGIEKNALAKIDVEDLLSMAEAQSTLSGELEPGNIEPGRLPLHQMIYGFIVDVVSSSICWLSNETCGHHDYLAREFLCSDDVVINFNYDPIMEVSLLKTGKWTESSGYGFVARAPTGMESLPTSRSRIVSLKLHGSLNWLKGRHAYDPSTFEDTIDVIRLRDYLDGILPREQRSLPHKVIPETLGFLRQMSSGAIGDSEEFVNRYSRLLQGGPQAYLDSKLPFIVVPTHLKQFNTLKYAQLQQLWLKAYQSVIGCEEIISIGFSFRDPHFTGLLLRAISKRSGQLKMTIVDPAAAAYSGIQKTLESLPIELVTVEETLESWLSSLSSR